MPIAVASGRRVLTVEELSTDYYRSLRDRVIVNIANTLANSKNSKPKVLPPRANKLSMPAIKNKIAVNL